MQYRVMVTAGANQAFVNVVLTLLDAGDSVVLFVPYYFNHLMAIQMTGGAANVVYGQCDPATLHPDLDWLEKHLQGPGMLLTGLQNSCKTLVCLPDMPPVQSAGNVWVTMLWVHVCICTLTLKPTGNHLVIIDQFIQGMGSDGEVFHSKYFWNSLRNVPFQVLDSLHGNSPQR